jgi:hypothetical protein
MPRWIVFDPATAAELRSRLPRAAVFEAPGRAVVEYALASSKGVVVVLPAEENRPSIAIFRPDGVQTTPRPEKTSRTRPRGILGLSEGFDEEEEEVPPEKSWWRRLWS